MSDTQAPSNRLSIEDIRDIHNTSAPFRDLDTGHAGWHYNRAREHRGILLAEIERLQQLLDSSLHRNHELECHALEPQAVPQEYQDGWHAGMAEAQTHPIGMVLYCPSCGKQHIDAPDDRTPDWKNPPHKSHLCHGCGTIWRPADVPTVGVTAIATIGKADTWSPSVMTARVAQPPTEIGAGIPPDGAPSMPAHADWGHVSRVLMEARQRLQEGGVRHSWMDAACDIAYARSGEGRG